MNPLEDFETESRIQGYNLEDGSKFKSIRLPAKIVVKIKIERHDDQTNKRAFSRTSKKRPQP